MHTDRRRSLPSFISHHDIVSLSVCLFENGFMAVRITHIYSTAGSNTPEQVSLKRRHSRRRRRPPWYIFPRTFAPGQRRLAYSSCDFQLPRDFSCGQKVRQDILSYCRGNRGIYFQKIHEKKNLYHFWWDWNPRPPIPEATEPVLSRLICAHL